VLRCSSAELLPQAPAAGSSCIGAPETGEVVFFVFSGALAAGIVVDAQCTHRFVEVLATSGELGAAEAAGNQQAELLQVVEAELLAVLPAALRCDAVAWSAARISAAEELARRAT
jgi:hypothetical protein